jgi:hypothetical protein
MKLNTSTFIVGRETHKVDILDIHDGLIAQLWEENEKVFKEMEEIRKQNEKIHEEYVRVMIFFIVSSLITVLSMGICLSGYFRS